ncbi:hypothetical protein GH714_003640 [Hevea brasiliensis]|uniref:Uncharacterized protein n=1 Tax=Hevea brasiliensis TaxID=3981 RepID=A0A6A6L9U4_HEVBR|nr:hypothetical protein GH714_003640 [Hevea brasiliensis]
MAMLCLPKPRRLSGTFRILPNDGISRTSFGFYLSRRTVFLIRLPDSHNQAAPKGWLVKIEEDIPDRKRLLNPLSRDECPTGGDDGVLAGRDIGGLIWRMVVLDLWEITLNLPRCSGHLPIGLLWHPWKHFGDVLQFIPFHTHYF